MNTVRSFVIFACIVSAVSAINPNIASADLRECFEGCQQLFSNLPDDAEIPTDDVMFARCAVEVPACAALGTSGPDLASVDTLCNQLAETRRRRTTPAPTVCVLPDGTSLRSASGRCRCPESAPFALAVTRGRSAALPLDGLRSGDRVYICYNPRALSGEPGSSEERLAAAEAAITEANAALTALCEPTAGEDLSAACARARTEFLMLGSSEGPVDLAPIRDEIATVRGMVEELQTQVSGMGGTIATLSHRVDTLVECLQHGESHEITYTDTTGVTGTYRCPDILAAARGSSDEEILAEAERVAERTAERTAERVVAEASHNAPGDVYVMGGLYGLVSFNSLRFNGVDRGLPWQIGADLTLGIALGGGWNIAIGGGVGGAGGPVPGVTDIGTEIHIGFNAWLQRWGLLGFGGLSHMRFMPDGTLAQAMYGGYGEFTIRILPNSEWSPVVTARAFIGATPRGDANSWHVEPDGGIMLVIGVAHFTPERVAPPLPPEEEEAEEEAPPPPPPVAAPPPAAPVPPPTVEPAPPVEETPQPVVEPVVEPTPQPLLPPVAEAGEEVPPDDSAAPLP